MVRRPQLLAGLKIYDISPIYQISVMFDTISAIDNRLREKLAKNR